jgi:uncharacterized membrane-anchored protein YjiN (DUF445 family)
VLENDTGVRAGMEQAIEGVIATLLPSAQAQIADFIASVIGGWNAAYITDRLELHVGKDLQYVRVNGTLVGFLVGGIVYAMLRAVFGDVKF